MEDISKYVRMSGKTSSGSVNLCKTCTRGSVVEFSNNEKITKCHMLDKDLRNNVVECSDYYNKGLPSLRTLYETALIIVTDPKKGFGFKRYADLKKKDESFSEEYDKLPYDKLPYD